MILLAVIGPLFVGNPMVLWALFTLPLVFWFTRGADLAVSRRRTWTTTSLRALAILLVVMALADVRFLRSSRDLAVGAVVDSSRSVSDAERANALSGVESDIGGQDHVYILPPGADRSVGPGRQLQSAAARLPSDRVRRVVLATDGNDVDGSLRAAVHDAVRTGTSVDVLAIGERSPADAFAVAALRAPALVRAGEPVHLSADVFSTKTGRVRVVAQLIGARGSQERKREEHEVSTRGSGEQGASDSVDFDLLAPEVAGVYELQVRLENANDAVAENNVFRTLVRVTPRPRVVIATEDVLRQSAVAQALRSAKFDVEMRRPGELPQDESGYERYVLAIVEELDLERLSDTEQRALRGYVETRGGGYIHITGGHPVRTPPALLRAIEPVLPASAIPEPRPLELMLVVDRSSSMEGQAMQMARRGALAAVQALRIDARVGVVAFSDGADRVMPPVPMTDVVTVTGFISSIFAGGGTNIGAAIAAARRAMSTDPRYLHHIILLSDGESDPNAAYVEARAAAAAGMSISTITIGTRSALMDEIARIGRGRYHVTSDASTLPALFIREAQFRQPPANRTGKFVPRVVTASALLRGTNPGAWAPLTGHVLADVRPNAHALLATSEGFPLLAHWQFGAGQVATFTSQTTGGWSDAWRASPAFREFWAQAAVSMQRTYDVQPVTVELQREPFDRGSARVIVTTSSPASIPPMARIYREPGAGEALRLVDRGVGVYDAVVPIRTGFLIDAALPTVPGATEDPTAGQAFPMPYDEEMTRFGVDRANLAELAKLGNGTVITKWSDAMRPVKAQKVAYPIRSWLGWAALAAYIAAVLALRLPDRGRRRAAAQRSSPRAGKSTDAPANVSERPRQADAA